MKKSPSVADLFCGSGGLSLGLKMTGYKLKFCLDVDWNAVYTYKENNPEVSWINKDIRKVSADEIIEVGGFQKGEIDLLVAGIPCEGYSMLNRRYNPSDPRNFLFLEFMRIVKNIQPKNVLIENVSGLARRASGDFKEAIIGALKKLGFKVTFLELNSVHYGVPQKRIRVFFIGTKGKTVTPPTPTHGEDLITIDNYNSKSSIKKKRVVTVKDAISDLPNLESNEEKFSNEKSDTLTPFQKLMRSPDLKISNHKAPNHPEWTIKRIADTKPGTAIYETFKQRKRLGWDQPAPTVPAGGVRPQWFFGHPEQPRGLTVREKARLQSYPDWYEFYGPITKQRILVGDSVPPLLTKAIGEKLKEYIN